MNKHRDLSNRANIRCFCWQLVYQVIKIIKDKLREKWFWQDLNLSGIKIATKKTVIAYRLLF